MVGKEKLTLETVVTLIRARRLRRAEVPKTSSQA